jgi:hypothetical protein
LQVSDRTDAVTITEDAGNVQLESAEIRDVVARRQVLNLPVKGRQFLDLAMLSPGVVRPPGGPRGDAMQQAGNLVNVLGQRSGHNLYLIDGVAITDEHFNNMVIAPSIDAIEEFNIEDVLCSGIRGQVRSGDQRRQQIGIEQFSRRSIRVRPQQRVRCQKLLRFPSCSRRASEQREGGLHPGHRFFKIVN